MLGPGNHTNTSVCSFDFDFAIFDFFYCDWCSNFDDDYHDDDIEDDNLSNLC